MDWVRAFSTRDRGSASVLAVVWLLVLVALGAAAATLVSAWHARVRVATAADLAALAAASVVLEQPDQSCAAAAEVAEANGAVLRECQLQGVDVWVETSIAFAGPVGPSGGWTGQQLRARSHATITERD